MLRNVQYLSLQMLTAGAELEGLAEWRRGQPELGGSQQHRARRFACA
jgi:hypothetical protein